MMYYGCCD